MSHCNKIGCESKAEQHLFSEFGFFHHWIINVPTSCSSWEGSVLGEDPSKMCSARCLTVASASQTQTGADRWDFFFPLSERGREENKRLLTWWPVTNHHLSLAQVWSRISIPSDPPATSALNLNFFQAPFKPHENAIVCLAWMNTDTDLSKLLSHLKLGDS